MLATGECYEEIGRLYEEQPRLDWEIIQDMMHDYRGLLSGWPQVLQIHSVCVNIIGAWLGHGYVMSRVKRNNVEPFLLQY